MLKNFHGNKDSGALNEVKNKNESLTGVELETFANNGNVTKEEEDTNLAASEACDGVQGEAKVSTEEVFRPKQPARWRLKLASLYIAFLFLGFATGTLGPSLVDLEELYDVDTATLSIVFTVGGMGYLAGSLLCGFIYDFFNYELQFTIAMLIMGATTAAMPWPDQFAGYVGLNAVEQAAGGFLDAGGQAYILYQVKGHRLQEAFMQAAHAAWSVGITIVPLVIEPFLGGKLDNEDASLINTTVISSLNSTQEIQSNISHRQYLYRTAVTAQNILQNYTDIGNIISNDTDLSSTDVSCQSCNSTNQGSQTRVRYGYLLCGLIVCFFSFTFCFILVLEPKFCLQKSRHKKHPDTKAKQENVRHAYFVISLVILFVWFFSQCWVETTLGSFVATFAIKRLGWSRQAGAYVTSGMWGGELAGRIVSVPIAAFLAPRTMVYISVIGAAVGCGMLLALATVHDVFFWLGVIISGVALSSGFGSTILWSANYIPVTGVAASVFLVGASAGSTVGPVLVGVLFDQYGPMCFLYVVFAGSVLQIAATLAYEFVIRKCTRLAQNKEKREAPSEQVSLKDAIS